MFHGPLWINFLRPARGFSAGPSIPEDLPQSASPGQTHVFLGVSPIELSSRIGIDVDTVKRGILQLKENRFLGIAGEQLELFDLDALRKLYRLMGMKENLKKE